jgi:small subunit ribosomal protein S3
LGQKTHPIGFRLGIIKTWNSRWYAPDRNFADLVYEDMMIKRYINRRLSNAGIATVNISRAPKKVTVDIHTSRPGIVIGRKGAEVDKLREELQLLTSKDILLNIVEVRRPELDARLVADTIARQLEGRVSFRRALKKALAATMKMGAVGIKVQCAGRLGGAEIARTEKYKDGRVPLHTLRADIAYSTSTARTTYGCIGVKVWICRGEILEQGQFYNDTKEEQAPPREEPAMRRRRRPDDRKGKRPRGRIRRPAAPDRAAPRGRRPDQPGQSAGGNRPAPKPASAGSPKPAPTGPRKPRDGGEKKSE